MRITLTSVTMGLGLVVTLFLSAITLTVCESINRGIRSTGTGVFMAKTINNPIFWVASLAAFVVGVYLANCWGK